MQFNVACGSPHTPRYFFDKFLNQESYAQPPYFLTAAARHACLPIAQPGLSLDQTKSRVNFEQQSRDMFPPTGYCCPIFQFINTKCTTHQIYYYLPSKSTNSWQPYKRRKLDLFHMSYPIFNKTSIHTLHLKYFSTTLAFTILE